MASKASLNGALFLFFFFVFWDGFVVMGGREWLLEERGYELGRAVGYV